MIFLPVLLALGVITTIEDFKYSLIRNRWIALALVYAVCIYTCTGAGVALKITGYDLWQHIDKWGINLVISGVVGYALWYNKMWQAGDAKLFMAYAALIPYSHYPVHYWSGYFPGFYLLLATFIPAMLFFVFVAFFHHARRCISMKDFGIRLFGRLTANFVPDKLSMSARKAFLFLVILFLVNITRTVIFSYIPHALTQNSLIAFFIAVAVFRKIIRKVDNTGFFYLLFFVFVLCMSLFFTFPLFDLRSFMNGFAVLVKTSIIITGCFYLVRKSIDSYVDGHSQATTPFAHWLFLGALITWFS